MASTTATEAPPVTVDLHRVDGSTAGTVDLPGELFGIEPNVPVLHQVVTAQLAAARSATAKAKTRGEVRGGGRKPWRQKGTGRARQGSIRAPQWTGGGVAHGPTGAQNPRKRVPKKLKRLALCSALSDRAASGDVRVVEDLAFEQPRTKHAVAALQALRLRERKVLLVLAERDEVVLRSFRNLPEVHLLLVDQLNAYDVLCSDVVVFQQAALPYVGTGRRRDIAGAGDDAAAQAGAGAQASAGAQAADEETETA